MSVQKSSKILGHRVAVYRLFAKDGTLLYVGVTAHVNLRMYNHKAEKHWWPLVARKTVKWYDSRADALKAEAAAIAGEFPVHNIAQRPAGCSRCGPGGWKAKRSA